MQATAKNAFRNLKQGGFTLIELMIVVAIIGVLASIAVPQYQNYVARAQVSEAISLASSAKTAVSEFYVTNGSFPESNTQAGVSSNDAGTDISGSYVSSVKIDTGGVITTTMAGNNSSVVGALQGASLIFTPNDTDANNSGSIIWTCGPGGTTPIPTQYLPASCRAANPDN